MATQRMLKDETAIIKSVMIKIDDDHCMIVSQSYHVERDNNDKIEGEKSKYRWMARVFTFDSLNKLINEWYDDANCLNKCRFPGDPDPWYFGTGKDATNKTMANWLITKRKKIMSWEDGQKFMAGYKKETATRKACMLPNAAYQVNDYVDAQGNLVSITDKVTLLNYVDQTLYKSNPKIRKTTITQNLI